MWCRLRALRDHGHLGLTVSVRASGVRAAGMGVGMGFPASVLCVRRWVKVSWGRTEALGQ